MKLKERLIKAQGGRARSAASRSSLAPLEPPPVSKGFNQRFLKTQFFIAARRFSSRPVQSLLVVFTVAFATALSCMLFLLAQGLQLGVIRAVEPFDLLVGPKGSEYQLVLNTVFLQDLPIGNLPWESCLSLSNDGRVAKAVPLCMGDSFKGYPLIGTTQGIFDIRVGPTAPAWLRIREGIIFQNDFEAVLGAEAASNSGLGVGDKFKTSHGHIGGDEHAREYTVVGITEAVHGPYDRAVLASANSVWEMHGHQEKEQKGAVTAILISPRSYADAYRLASEFQTAPQEQLVFPAQSAVRLFSIMGRGEAFLSVLVWSVFGFALLTTALMLYWSGAVRHREGTLLRVLGADRFSLLFIAWLEASMGILSGVLLGTLLGRLGFLAFSQVLEETAVSIFVPVSFAELFKPLLTAFVGSAVSVLPGYLNNRSSLEKLMGTY